MSADLSSTLPKRFSGVGLPPPDTPGGLALLGAIIAGVAFILVFGCAYSALSAEAPWVVGLTLILSVVLTLFLVSMVASDRSRAADFELEFARTVEAHIAAGETLVETTPLGGILTEYAHAAHEQRRAALEHAYAAGPAMYSSGFAVVSALFVGLAYAIGADPNTLGVGMLFELFAFFLLVLATGVLVLSVGRRSDVPEFAPLVPRRWSQVAMHSFPFNHALSEIPWAAHAPLPVNPPLWQENPAATPVQS
ncbi:MAG TPA: hypothetical protein VMH38_02495 [Thermoplasmata archaeon]|nr:hypothetical protein [Thermoplasmata archaeon]